MQVRHVRAGVWRVEGFVESGQADDMPVIVKVRRTEDGLSLLKAWLWGTEVGEEDDWLVHAWVEEHEAEILELMGEGG